MASGWTHALCDPCWAALEPDRAPVRMAADHREAETCCLCGAEHRSGIYYRAAPAGMPACPGHAGD